jgi:hypothetical protein
MSLKVASRIVTLALVTIGVGAIGFSCGSVTAVSDGGASGAAGSSGGGTSGSAGTGGSGGGGTTGAAGTGGTDGGTGGGGGTRLDAGTDVGALGCHVDLNDCPQGYTCACGGAGAGMCTCHRNCTDANQCPTAEPMCGCASTTGGARFCVNACFCSCN